MKEIKQVRESTIVKTTSTPLPPNNNYQASSETNKDFSKQRSNCTTAPIAIKTIPPFKVSIRKRFYASPLHACLQIYSAKYFINYSVDFNNVIPECNGVVCKNHVRFASFSFCPNITLDPNSRTARVFYNTSDTCDKTYGKCCNLNCVNVFLVCYS